jgi:transcriptional regulator with XRE-family HTH domain
VESRRSCLAARRKALGYTQESFAEQLGVDRTTVGRLERGETDPYPHLRRELRRALQMTATELDAILTLEPGDDERSPGTRQPVPAASQDAVPRTDWTGALDDMHRRELFRLLSVAGVAVVIPAANTAGDLLHVPLVSNVIHTPLIIIRHMGVHSTSLTCHTCWMAPEITAPPCAMPRFRWPLGQAGSGMPTGPVPLHHAGRDSPCRQTGPASATR